ncbi:MAG: VWA domain-containing protein [Rhodospirillales bacterium]
MTPTAIHSPATRVRSALPFAGLLAAGFLASCGDPGIEGTLSQRTFSPPAGQSGLHYSTQNRATPPAGAMQNNDRYPSYALGTLQDVATNPVSTFSADVDTASYAIARRHIAESRLPPAGSVRIEEMVNYFDYDYPEPAPGGEPVAVDAVLMPTPWKHNSLLLRINLQTRRIAYEKRPPANLVFLIDRSSSMNSNDRIGLVRQTFRALVPELREDDRVAIVAYASSAELILPPTPGDRHDLIISAVDGLQANGSTNGDSGLEIAYELARQNYRKGATNRVILATDGDFNVGATDAPTLLKTIRTERKNRIYLSVLGFGLGNLNDALMQRISQAGNGVAAYIDSVAEARKVMAAEMTQNLYPVADDVKLQVEFNPARISAWRQIGYESRQMSQRDFDDPDADAAEIGNGHAVTVLYELFPAEPVATTQPKLRYASLHSGEDHKGLEGELAFVKLRYRDPKDGTGREIVRAVNAADLSPTVKDAPVSARFASAVAAFGGMLRGEFEPDSGFGFSQIMDLAEPAAIRDDSGNMGEFLQIVESARTLYCRDAGWQAQQGRKSDICN